MPSAPIWTAPFSTAPEEKLIWCACHNGRYDLTGKNISGPPPRPLEEFKVNVRGDEIVVSRG